MKREECDIDCGSCPLYWDSKCEDRMIREIKEEYANWHKEHFKGKRDITLSGEYLERKTQIELAIRFADWGYKKGFLKGQDTQVC